VNNDHDGPCKVRHLAFGRELAGLRYRGCSLRFWSLGQLQVRPHSDEVVGLLESLLGLDVGSWARADDIMEAKECGCLAVYWVWDEQQRRAGRWTEERWSREASRVLGVLLEGSEHRA